MFPPSGAHLATRFTVQGVPVDVVWMDGTRVYFPIVADWIDEEIKLTTRGLAPRRRRQPARLD